MENFRLEQILIDATEEYFEKTGISVNVTLEIWKHRKGDPIEIEYILATVDKKVWSKDFESLPDLLFFIQHPGATYEESM